MYLHCILVYIRKMTAISVFPKNLLDGSDGRFHRLIYYVSYDSYNYISKLGYFLVLLGS